MIRGRAALATATAFNLRFAEVSLRRNSVVEILMYSRAFRFLRSGLPRLTAARDIFETAFITDSTETGGIIDSLQIHFPTNFERESPRVVIEE